MNKYPILHSFLYKILLITLIFSISGCGGISNSEIQGDLINGGGPHRLLGFVYDPAGQPVAFAEVGGEDFSSWDGVSTGNFLDYEGSWIPVHALGYASSYAKAQAEEQDLPFFNATLTPYQDLVKLMDGEEALLSGSNTEVSWTAAVSSSQFSSPEVMVGLAVLDPVYVEPRIVLKTDAPDLRLRTALALESFSSQLEYGSLKEGQVIELVLTLPSPLTEAAEFARFDPQTGSWQTVDLGCTIGEEYQYTCQLDFLDPLIGLFDLPDSFAETDAAGSGGALASRSRDAGSDFDDAYGALVDWMLDQQAASGGIDPQDPALKKLIDNLTNAAKKYAKDNRSEGGKSTLAKAAQAAMSTGQSAAAQSLLDEMGKIADELGKKALQESDCGEFEKMLKAAEQIMRTSGNEALAQELIKKAGEMTKDCDVWDGTITVWMRAASNHPAGLPMQGSGGMWMENHKVKIWTNVDDFVMHGESKISLSFPAIKYVQEKNCKQEITMSGSGGQIKATFQGSFNGHAFQVSGVDQPGSGGSIQQSWRFESKEDDQCVMQYSQDFSMNPYYSILLHGLSSDSPPLNYQEILDSASNFDSEKGITRFGGDESFGNPDPDLGIYPYEQITVSWYFYHTQHKLPIDQE